MRIHFVINPRAGRIRHQEMATAIREEFASYDIRIATQPPSLSARQTVHIEDILWPPTEPEQPTMVVAVGGDGTVNRVINAVGDTGAPVGILPQGTSNDLAQTLSIPSDFHQACDVIKKLRLTEIDLISVNGAYFATSGGIGLAADVAAAANRWRDTHGWPSRLARALGKKIYPLAVLGEICGGWRPPSAHIFSQEGDLESSWFSLLVSNQPSFGGFCASPAASNGDGVVDICQMKAPSRRIRMLWMSLQTLRGRADSCPEVSQQRAKEAFIVTQDPVYFFGDGEILDWGRYFHIQVRPKSLRLVVPHGEKVWRWRRPHTPFRVREVCYV